MASKSKLERNNTWAGEIQSCKLNSCTSVEMAPWALYDCM